ncbi:MAG: hypothetical protein V3U98_07090 [Acidobacteriota bacterium]
MTASAHGSKKLLLRGHEVVVHTAPSGDGGFYAFAVLPVRTGDEEGARSIEVRAESEIQAEVECARQALHLLEQAQQSTPVTESIKANRWSVDILGYRVDIYCDLVGHESYQAFPFLYRPDGKRVIMIRFHLDEAIVADSADQARDACICRLEEYFREDIRRRDARTSIPHSRA